MDSQTDVCSLTDVVCTMTVDNCRECELYQAHCVVFTGDTFRDTGIQISKGQVVARAGSMLLLIDTFYDRKIPKKYVEILDTNPIIDEMYPVYRWLVEQHKLGKPDKLMMSFKQPLLAHFGQTWYLIAPRYEH